MLEAQCITLSITYTSVPENIQYSSQGYLHIRICLKIQHEDEKYAEMVIQQ